MHCNMTLIYYATDDESSSMTELHVGIAAAAGGGLNRRP